MTEVTAIIISGSGFIIINLVGWIWNSKINARKDGKWEGIVDTKIKSIFDKADDIANRIDKLPCVADTDYQKNMGGMAQKITDIGDRIERIENKVNSR